MTTLFVLDTPENRPVVDVADTDPTTTVTKVGPYFRVQNDNEIDIDRRSTQCRHAVWYSSVAGLHHSRIAQWDKDKLLVVER